MKTSQLKVQAEIDDGLSDSVKAFRPENLQDEETLFFSINPEAEAKAVSLD